MWTSGKQIARFWEHEEKHIFLKSVAESPFNVPFDGVFATGCDHRVPCCRGPQPLLPSYVCCAALESCSRRSSARGLLSPCMVHPLVGFSVGDLFCCVRCAPTRQAAQHDFFYGARLLRDLLSFQVACAMYVYQCAIAARRPCPAGQQAYIAAGTLIKLELDHVHVCRYRECVCVGSVLGAYDTQVIRTLRAPR